MFHFSMAIMSEYKVLHTGYIYFPLHTTNSPWKVGIGAIQIYYPVIPQTLATKKESKEYSLVSPRVPSYFWDTLYYSPLIQFTKFSVNSVAILDQILFLAQECFIFPFI